ncbi:MAG: 23S rRNA (uracil(1939)-C(5))-methyltransferase RlmD [Candidatus Hydrogenedentes bacterium]|nr:23S rRNA (uracil(1939)-C(5))-methyltransferase RlmD [Candidatus Hydrogenedentota bacterium]
MISSRTRRRVAWRNFRQSCWVSGSGNWMDEHCTHFGDCGGCKFQDVPYPEQLARKSAVLEDLLGELWGRPVPVDPSPEVWHYRNKVDLSFSPKWYAYPPPPGFEREPVLGFKTRGRWYKPTEIIECRIGPPDLSALLGSVRAWMERNKLRAFDSRTHQGFLRILLVRHGKRTGQRMVVLITADGTLDRGSFVEAVQTAWHADSIYHGVFHGLADVAAADESELIEGAPAIEEELRIPDGKKERVLRFRLSPFSFFQTNTRGAERLYGKVRGWVKRAGPRRLYDLYGGAGGIAMTCADLVEHVWSVENVESATIDGRQNLSINGVANVTFATAKVEAWLKELLLAKEHVAAAGESAAVVDPPRAGMHRKATWRLVELGPRWLLYISCNPGQFVRELPALQEAYDLRDISAVDLFPHTDHVELVAEFVRKS